MQLSLASTYRPFAKLPERVHVAGVIYLITLLGKLFCFLIGMQYVGCPCNNNEVKSFCDDFWCVHTGAEEIIFPWEGLP